jgi:exonuclease SbcC
VDAKKRWEKCGLLEEAVSKTLDLSGNAKELKKELKKIKEYRIGIEESKNGYERYVELTEELEKLKDVESDGKVKLEGLQARWEKKIRELRDVIAAKKSEESRIRKAVNELEEADDRCPICGQELDEEHKRRVFEEYECEMRVLKEELARLEKDLESVEEDAAIEYTKAMDELKARSRALESEREKYADAYMGYIAADSYLKKFATDEEKLSEDLKAIERKLSAMWESIEDDAKRAGLYDMLKPIPPEEWGRAARDVRKKLQLRLDMINGEIKRLEREQGRLEGELKAVKDALEEYKIEVTRLNAKVAENEKLKRFTAFLTEIRGLFGKDHLQRELRLRHKPRIERYTKEHFEKFNLAYTDVTLTDDYSIVVYDSQGERSADMLSGGERISAALALRFGIANDLLESASAMELMILDEPTIHLDEHRRQELVDIVKRLSSIPQTIVVTHDREFEAAADRLISVVKEEGTSRVEYAGE